MGGTALLLFLSIIALSYLLEDVAIVSAALIASDGLLSLPAALLAIFVGIASGDLGLYLIGALANRSRALRYRLLRHKSMKVVRRRLLRNSLANIFIIRFIPGLRSVGYTFCGFFRVNIFRFLVAVLLATALWTAVIFTLIYQIGASPWLTDSPFKWVLVPIALVLLWWVNRRQMRPVRQVSEGTAA